MKILTFISVVAYTENRADAVGPFLVHMNLLLNRLFETHEIILVDQEGAAVREALAVKDQMQGNVSVVSLRGKHGRDMAISAGTDLCIGDYIFETDSITSLPRLEEFSKILAAITGGQGDIVIAGKSRMVTRRALYALDKTLGVDRTQRYKNCGFDWVLADGTKAGRAIFALDNILARDGFFPKLLWLLTGLSLAGAILFFSLHHLLPALLLLGFALTLLALAIIYRRIEALNLGPGNYQVSDITRINRF